jgi:ubiquinol-cytochrome c reductase cytochrome b subunit
MYIIHVLLIPGLILALITAHLFIMVHQKHTQMPAKGNTETNVVGQPFFPYFMAKGGAWFFFIFAACAVLATFATINPIWLYGPYTPVAISSASQPDWYMGILEGSLRMMPAWEWNFLGHTLSLSVLIPFIVPLTVVLGGAAFWPFFERWATGDKSWHNINDRPRNAPIRTATGIATVTFYGVLWAEGANDVIADKLQIPLYTVTWIARVLIFVGPLVAFIVTRRICLGLQRKDRDLLEHGLETGIIRQLPHGEYIEVHRPLDAEERAPLEAKKVPALLPAPGSADENGVPAPQARGVMGRTRAIANSAFAETIVVEADGHGNGHGDGHGPAEEHAAVGAGPADAGERAEIGPGELPESSIPHEDPLVWHSHEEPPEDS